MDNLRKLIDDDVLEVCPILRNHEFLEKYPGIINVAEFIHTTARSFIRLTGSYPLFDRLGVKKYKRVPFIN